MVKYWHVCLGALFALRCFTPWWHVILRRTLFSLDDAVAAVLGPGGEPYGHKWRKGYWQPVPSHLAGKVRPGLLPLEGRVPNDLRGVYVRNGPNPVVDPRDGYHPFGGDGYIHAIRFPGDGTVTYSGDFARTPKFETESHAREALYMSMGDIVTGKPGLLGISRMMFDQLRQLTGAVPRVPLNNGPVSTAVLHHHHRIFALSEGSLPFRFSVAKNGTLRSHGFDDFGGKLEHAITAHPKVDPKTGELIFFSYEMQEPFAWHGVVSREGKVLQYFKFPLPHPVMIHDMFFTEHWTVIFDLPVRFQPKRIVSHGDVFHFDKSAPATLLLIPRHAKDASEIHRITLREPFYCFHTVAALEKDNELTLFFQRTEELSLVNFDNFEPHLWRFDVRLPGPKGEPPIILREKKLSSGKQWLEFPAIHPDFVLNTRWAWISISRTDAGEVEGFSGIQKWDLEAGEKVAEITYGSEELGGEAIFAPRSGSPSEEENGYLLTLLHNKTTWQTHAAVFDARTMQRISLTPMPHQIPGGFHGIWLPEEDFRSLEV